MVKLQIFMIKNISKIDSNHTFLAVINLDSTIKKVENYFLQVFLKQCKDINKKLISHINDNLSDFPSSNFPDEE